MAGRFDGRELLLTGGPHILRDSFITSAAFAGRRRREAWLGCLLAECIMHAPMPATGHPPPHWRW